MCESTGLGLAAEERASRTRLPRRPGASAVARPHAQRSATLGSVAASRLPAARAGWRAQAIRRGTGLYVLCGAVAASDHADRQRYSIWDSVVARLQRGELRAWGRAGSLSASERPIDADMWHASPMGNPAQGSVAFGDRRTGETWHRVHIAQMEDAPPATSGNRGTSAASAGKTAAKDATWREIAKHVRACRDQSPSDWAAMTPSRVEASRACEAASRLEPGDSSASERRSRFDELIRGSRTVCRFGRTAGFTLAYLCGLLGHRRASRVPVHRQRTTPCNR
jgi:hypothetical protein